MIDIQLAGAGAGKTFGLARDITNYILNCDASKKIFALTYTNSATIKIQSEVKRSLGYIPPNLTIQTVHSFLLHEIIYPFSTYALNETYSKISLQPIGNPQFKNSFFSRLRTNNIIHAENVYHISRMILDKNCSRHTNRVKKAKIDFILSLISTTIDKIYIDEVQDLDEDALIAFDALGQHLKIYMIGDTKQALKWTDSLRDYISKSKDLEHINLLPINNSTLRVPTEILSISNLFCYQGQEQESLNSTTGILNYIESSDDNYHSYLKTKTTTALVYIEQKQGVYLTRQEPKKISFPHEIKQKISQIKHNKNPELFEAALLLDLTDSVILLGVRQALNAFLRKYNIQLTAAEYAQLASCLDNDQSDVDNFIVVSSIDAAKGLDAEHCIFILTRNTARYLSREIPESSYYNKEWMRMYVALTRTKRELTLAIDHSLFLPEEIAPLIEKIELLGFTKSTI
ncbi:UvrD-helicase domain-containing protein [Klebsiella variicola]|uniref:UvrD-helicase domain-containing protein n=1 Tax=Klebsiella variicola TaxID=244366 RepID=UPI002FF66EE6